MTELQVCMEFMSCNLECFSFLFQTAMMCLCSCFIAFMLTFIGAQKAESKVMFFIWVCALFWLFSGNFALFPTAIAKTFGTKYMAVNYGLLFTSQVILKCFVCFFILGDLLFKKNIIFLVNVKRDFDKKE